MISNGVRMQPREVVGLHQVNDDLYYIAHPKYPQAVAISGESAGMILANSRPFAAQPDALFDSFDFTPLEEKSAKPKPVKVPKPAAAEVPIPPPEPEPKPPVDTPIDDDRASKEARQRRELDRPQFGKFTPLQYSDIAYAGGTPNNYAIQPLPKCGTVHLEVRGADELNIPGLNISVNGVSPPAFVLKDIQDNVMPAVGLNVNLPFKRLYVSILGGQEGNDVGGSHISTYMIRGFMYGVIAISPQQLVRLLGGYNSKSMAHVMTHELAHFVDHTMLRNVDRMKFDQAIRGKRIHPDSNNALTIKSVPTEHFATLAELMVWGDSLRNVYTLNGVEVVNKYFENRYIPQSDIDSRKV
ncbi:hypothetical protein MPK74_gp150 [Erwinia phage pEa_SNUABM_7]|uniref:KTSC and Metallopeptidase-like N-terminal fusion domain-containing protein n=1 Tax=Erwinia phage pEa_SNUABM_7 TaxID=2866695 RepID=A0AAE7WSA3_9CAUD|nr:hypothetical protein MPK74_gp150 [Erwinia phage pEa_SNUABM_7]QYW04818.1 hypothetical protein pEaSNUABM7_00150 [Erwinia phage pEa_SNUABM_7]